MSVLNLRVYKTTPVMKFLNLLQNNLALKYYNKIKANPNTPAYNFIQQYTFNCKYKASFDQKEKHNQTFRSQNYFYQICSLTYNPSSPTHNIQNPTSKIDLK